MKLDKDDKLLKSSLLSDIEGNIKTLNGTAKTYTDGQEVSALTLIDESIQELAELKDLLKGAKQMEHLDKDEQRIMELLPTGMEQPRPLKGTNEDYGWSSRKVRMTITRLIVLHHKPIGAVYGNPITVLYYH